MGFVLAPGDLRFPPTTIESPSSSDSGSGSRFRLFAFGFFSLTITLPFSSYFGLFLTPLGRPRFLFAGEASPFGAGVVLSLLPAVLLAASLDPLPRMPSGLALGTAMLRVSQKGAGSSSRGRSSIVGPIVMSLGFTVPGGPWSRSSWSKMSGMG